MPLGPGGRSRGTVATIDSALSSSRSSSHQLGESLHARPTNNLDCKVQNGLPPPHAASTDSASPRSAVCCICSTFSPWYLTRKAIPVLPLSRLVDSTDATVRDLNTYMRLVGANNT